MRYTLTINSRSKQALAFLEFAKSLDFVKVTENEVMPKTEKKYTEKQKQELIDDLTKSTNKAIAKKMFAHFGMPYPEKK